MFKKLIRSFVFIVLSVMPSFAYSLTFAEPDVQSEVETKAFLKTYKGIGVFRVRLDTVYEPVSKPKKLHVEVRCAGESVYQNILSDLAMCEFLALNVSKDGKVAHIKFKSYAPQEETCSMLEEKVLNLPATCKK